MTVGIAASGKNATEHALRALRSIETLGSGAIGGFAVLAVMTGNGQVQYAQTQKGGSAGLHVDAAWLRFERAAIISSGPNRPEPLQQFLPGLDGIGLVTGHRLPHRAFANSRLNLAVLARLQNGLSPEKAISEVLTANPECDAGLMALTAEGKIAYANSERVRRRGDIHSSKMESADSSIALMMNSIYFSPEISKRVAEMICELALHMSPTLSKTGAMLLNVSAECPVAPAGYDQVIVDLDSEEVVAIHNADPLVEQAEGRWPVIQNGCPATTTEGQQIGVCLHDLVGDVRKATVRRLSVHSALQLVIGAPQ